MSDLIRNINDADFEKEVIKSSKPVIVDFWASWCGPCLAISPFMEELAKKTDKVSFVKINVDENNLKASEIGVRGIPTLVLYKDGVEAGRVVGADSNAIESLVNSI